MHRHKNTRTQSRTRRHTDRWTRQTDKTRQDKTGEREIKTTQDNMTRHKTRQHTTKQDQTRWDKRRQGETRGRQDKTRQDKSGHGKTTGQISKNCDGTSWLRNLEIMHPPLWFSGTWRSKGGEEGAKTDFFTGICGFSLEGGGKLIKNNKNSVHSLHYSVLKTHKKPFCLRATGALARVASLSSSVEVDHCLVTRRSLYL